MKDIDSIIDKVFRKDELLKLFWDASPLLLSVVDMENKKFELVNPAWKNLMKMSYVELTNKSFFKFIAQRDLDSSRAAHTGNNEVLQSGRKKDVNMAGFDYEFINHYIDSKGQEHKIAWYTATASDDGKYAFCVAKKMKNER